jgi:hypothetical protein
VLLQVLLSEETLLTNGEDERLVALAALNDFVPLCRGQVRSRSLVD